ncbi:MAG: DUF4383 domain-containing protein [Patescibacteria group bacterium]|nr:DUF4383 domain-containing protein [Patescibacteria group bacterium]
MTKKPNLILAAFLFFLGLVGFLPNPVVGNSGFLKTDTFHNFLHILLGLLLLTGVLWKSKSAGLFGKLGGAFLVFLSVAGFLFAKNEKLFGLLTANVLVNWLHLILGIAFFAASSEKEKISPPAPTV